MPALAAGIDVLNAATNKDLDARNKSGHDSCTAPSKAITL